MTKHCLRLLFLAAAALPIAHGCSDGALECLGTAVACGNRDISECSHGCEVRNGCHGDARVNCASLTDSPNLCVQTAGCTYLGSCDGAQGCSLLTYEDCLSREGCMQVRRCDGNGVSCADLEQSQCGLYSQCTMGAQCVGTATRCSSLDSTSACQDVPGCYAADTTPAVVGRGS